MKKAFLCFALVLCLTLGLVVPAALSLHQARDQVTVTSATTYGDHAQAAGLTAKQSAQYNDHLRWDLTIPLDRPEDTATEFSYHQTLIGEPQPSHDLYMYVPNGTRFFHGSSTLEDAVEGSPEQKPLLPMFQDVASRTPNGKRYSETVTLKDYVDCYPLAVDLGGLPYGVLHSGEGSAKDPFWDDFAISQAFQDFFSFPVPEDEAWTVTIEKDDQGNLLELSTECPYPVFSPNVISTFGEDSLFFTFDQYSAANFEHTPGGFGLYRLGLVREGASVFLDLDSLANIHPLPENAVVLDLTDSCDGQTLLLTYCLGKDYTCEVLDPETMTVLQSFPVPADPPSPVMVHTEDTQGNEISYEETHWDLNGSLPGENFLVLYGDARFHLFSLENGTYTYEFSAPMEEHMLYYPYELLSGAWNGETLALASVSESTTGLSLSMFEAGELVYQGIYETSLNDAPVDQENPDNSYYFDPVHLLSGSKLTLTWA